VMTTRFLGSVSLSGEEEEMGLGFWDFLLERFLGRGRRGRRVLRGRDLGVRERDSMDDTRREDNDDDGVGRICIVATPLSLSLSYLSASAAAQILRSGCGVIEREREMISHK